VKKLVYYKLNEIQEYFGKFFYFRNFVTKTLPTFLKKGWTKNFIFCKQNFIDKLNILKFYFSVKYSFCKKILCSYSDNIKIFIACQ